MQHKHPLPIVLASQSPSRKTLLEAIHLDFIMAPSHIDETKLEDETPREMVARLAIEKAQVQSKHYPEHLIIGCDTTAVLEGESFGKQPSFEKAVAFIKKCSGKTIQYLSGMAVINSATGKILTSIDTYLVKYRALTNQQIENYVQREQPYDVAGALRWETLGITLLEKLTGDDPTGLQGLSLIKLTSLLREHEFEVL